jgi:hypothetical protein
MLASRAQGKMSLLLDALGVTHIMAVQQQFRPRDSCFSSGLDAIRNPSSALIPSLVLVEVEKSGL